MAAASYLKPAVCQPDGSAGTLLPGSPLPSKLPPDWFRRVCRLQAGGSPADAAKNALRLSAVVRRNLEADAAGGGSREFAGASAGAGAADVRLHTPDAEVDFDERASEAGGRGCQNLQQPPHN